MAADSADFNIDGAEALDLVLSLPFGVHFVRPDGVILWANPADHERLGYRREEYVGRNMIEVHADPHIGKKLRRALAAGERVIGYPSRLVCKDGSIRHVRITSSPRKDGGGRLAYSRCLVHDLTEAESAHDLEIVAVERERLMGIIGHDMRNPLMAIHLAASTLLRIEMHESATKLARRILDSSDRMQRMITQLVDFARIRAGAGLGIEPQPADLLDITRQVIDEIEVAFPSAVVRLEHEGDLHGQWDADRLSQVVSNLVANAIQHGRAGSPIKVGLVGADDEVALVVTNDGDPIPPEVVPSLFSPFRRARHARRPSYAAGTSLGLGLFIAQQVVDGHGGTIDVACADGTTTFTVTLPRSAG